ncbi:MAG: hypothetical protein QOC95_97 [Thermoleophilaceae bacterium]|nr:hypothetical protein [Thermoleophilaceae bacterium]
MSPQAQTAPADTTPAKDFAALHAAAVARDKTTAASPQSQRIETPEGETWAAEKAGTHFARIVAGPRAGQYINLTHGDRRGQTFTIEHREGKTLHVYGAGATEVLVKPSVDAAATTEAAKHVKHARDQPPKGEQWAPVDGHSTYADILEGPRNGQYVNISGGVRDGMAFQIVKKGDKVFHVYGTGKDKQAIEVGAKKAATASDSSASAASTGTAAATSTGGTAAGTGGSNSASATG